MSSPRESHAARYATIDAWRGLACLGVVLFHSFGALYHRSVWAPLEPLRAACHEGWLGLHLFFVLSGYCIFERLHVAGVRREPVAAFWADRALRIFPPYWGALLFSLALDLLGSPFSRRPASVYLPDSVMVWLSNTLLTHTFIGHRPYLLVSWTLSCELAFYLFAGALLWFGRRAGGLTGAFAVGFALCVAACFVESGGWSLPLAQWPDFFAGACVAFILRAARDRARADLVLGWLALLSLTLAAGLGLPNHAGAAHGFALVCAWLLIGLHRWDAPLRALPPVRALAWLGGISYSLYLVHVPFASRVTNLGLRFIPSDSPALLVFWLASVALTIAVGWGFWQLVEHTTEKFRTRRRSAFRAAAAGPIPAPLPGR